MKPAPISPLAVGVANQFYVQVTGFTRVLPNNIGCAIFTPAGTLAAGTVTLPAAPVDNQVVTIMSTAIITALTLNAGTASIVGNTTALAANVQVAYIYRKSNTTWYKLV